MTEPVTAGSPPAGTPPVDAWYKGKVDDVTVGYLQTRGWHDKPLEEVALGAIKAHQEATKMLSAPQDELVRVPKKADDPNWAAVYSKLGVPADAKEYDFSPLKRGEQPLDEATVAFLRESASTLKLSKQAALEFGQRVVKQIDAKATAEQAEYSAKLGEQERALRANWGNNFEANKFVAQQGALKLGLSAEEITGLEKLVGFDKVMEAFRRVGAMSGEDKFVRGNTNNGVMTREEAMNRKQELQSDVAWRNAYLGGSKQHLNEMLALNRIIMGVN